MYSMNCEMIQTANHGMQPPLCRAEATSKLCHIDKGG
jgi:hypothetical protein